MDSRVRVRSRQGSWKTNASGMERLAKAIDLCSSGNSFDYRRYFDDFPVIRKSTMLGRHRIERIGQDLCRANATKVIERCILMATDPGDLVLDPTCGSGTTAMSPSNGAGAGSRSTPRAWRWRWPAPASWARVSVLPAGRFREGQRQGSRSHRAAPARSRCTATSATASSMSACRTSRSNRSPTTPRSM